MVVFRARLTTGCVSEGLTNSMVPPLRTNRSPLRMMSPPLRFTRPRITGCAAVPRTRRFAEPLMLRVLLTRLILFSEVTPRFNWMFCASPGVAGGETPPEN